MPRTLFEKLWDEHIVAAPASQLPLLYVDLHLVHEVTSPQAFDGLRGAGRKVRAPLRTIATVDHNIPTEPRGTPITDEIAKRQIEALQQNCRDFGVHLFDMDSPDQGIVHVIGPELGYTQPGMTIVCGDSHTSTHGLACVLDYMSGRAVGPNFSQNAEHKIFCCHAFSQLALDLNQHGFRLALRKALGG